MPRVARSVFPGIPHHITQRGNRKEDVFYNDLDRKTYLDWLSDYCLKHDVDILAYCLMRNHVHLIAVPNSEDGLQSVLKPLHMRYAQRKNREFGWTGHFWQGRYFSSTLDENYMWAAIRYVERNPVRANLVGFAEDYKWSSAHAHSRSLPDPVLTKKPYWTNILAQIPNWSGWLAEGDRPQNLDILRRNAYKGLPCGSTQFVSDLSKKVGRELSFRPPGRPQNKR